MIGQFINLRGQRAPHFFPGVGDTGLLGTVVAVLVPLGYENAIGGTIHTDNNQNVPNSQWDFAPSSGGCAPIGYGDPLMLQFGGAYLDFVPCVGQRVKFDVIAAPYGAVATNLQPL
jgi:hypothetical protein